MTYNRDDDILGLIASVKARHAIEDCSNNGWEDAPAWGIICGCGWETWDATEEWIARDRHQDHVLEAFKQGWMAE